MILLCRDKVALEQDRHGHDSMAWRAPRLFVVLANDTHDMVEMK